MQLEKDFTVDATCYGPNIVVGLMEEELKQLKINLFINIHLMPLAPIRDFSHDAVEHQFTDAGIK